MRIFIKVLSILILVFSSIDAFSQCSNPRFDEIRAESLVSCKEKLKILQFSAKENPLITDDWFKLKKGPLDTGNLLEVERFVSIGGDTLELEVTSSGINVTFYACEDENLPNISFDPDISKDHLLSGRFLNVEGLNSIALYYENPYTGPMHLRFCRFEISVKSQKIQMLKDFEKQVSKLKLREREEI